LARWGGPALVAGSAVAMLAVTWNTWADVLIDFGQQLYIPWRLADGAVLYRDVATYNGPLSQYWNAMWFRLLGASMRTVVVANLGLLAGLIWLLYSMLWRVSSRLSASAACLVFVLVFAFGRYSGIGNYTYVCPYVHEMPHGLLLSLGALACVWGYSRRGWMALLGGGLCLGGAFLTKSEVFQAAAAGAVAALVLTIWGLRPGWKKAARMAGVFAVGALAPPAAAWALFCLAMPAREALSGVMGSWRALARAELTQLPFFREGLGFDNVWGNLWSMLTVAGAYLAVLVPPAVLAVAIRRAGKRRQAAAGVAFAAVAGAIWLLRERIDWTSAVRPLPLAMLAAGGVFLARFIRRRGDWATAETPMRRVSLCVLALCLLAKMILNVRVFNYGFVLAAPAALVFVVAILDWIPAVVARMGGAAWVFRAAALGLLLPVLAVHLRAQGVYRSAQRETVGSGADAFLADPRGQFVNALLADLASRAKPSDTLAVLPEGAMLNFLSRRVNPTPYTNFMPPEMLLFGQEAMLASLRARPPDWIVLVHKDTTEFGYQFFGRDYGQEIMAWITRNYSPVVLEGFPPFVDDRFGMLLLGRKAEAAQETGPPRG